MNHVTHKDWSTGKWNVFSKDENGKEEFVQAFDSLGAAESFCIVKNKVQQVDKKNQGMNWLSFLTK